MAKKYFTRAEVQSILSTNSLGADASYLDREGKGSPDNWIVYERTTANGDTIYADGGVHMRRVRLQVTHYHKRKLDSIESLMLEQFGVEPVGINVKQPETDYWGTYYIFTIFTGGEW